jgi:hypothetical protein
VDYEYIGHELNGLDLIEELKIESSSFLVTSRFDDKNVQSLCKKMNLGLIPKEMASLIPFVVNDDSRQRDIGFFTNKEIVLLDDDDLVRMVWETSAKNNSLNFRSFSTNEELLNFIKKFSAETLFYIDSSLCDGVKGEDVAKELYKEGFTELYLATGHDPSSFDVDKMPFIKGIFGKEPPWI